MNKRKHERFSADIPEISAKLLFSEDTRIRDISLGGIALTAEKGLKIDKEYIVRIKVHDKIVPVKGVVMWCKLCQSKNSSNGDVIPIYSMGLKFNDDRNGEIEELIEFIRSHRNPVSDEMDLERSDTEPAVFTAENEELLHLIYSDLQDKEKVFAVIEG